MKAKTREQISAELKFLEALANKPTVTNEEKQRLMKKIKEFNRKLEILNQITIWDTK